MNLIELQRALRQLRLGGMADVAEARLRQAQTEKMQPLDLLSTLVSDELLRRQDRLHQRRIKLAAFRDVGRTLDTFDFDFNKKMPRQSDWSFVRQLRGPHLRTWAWCSSRSSMAAMAAVSPRSLPQSSTGRFEVMRVEVRS